MPHVPFSVHRGYCYFYYLYDMHALRITRTIIAGGRKQARGSTLDVRICHTATTIYDLTTASDATEINEIVVVGVATQHRLFKQ